MVNVTAPIADPKQFLTDLFTRAIAEADPMKMLGPFLPARPKGRLIVIGAGKASARMAEAAEAHYGPCEGYVITRYGYERPCSGIEIVQAAHPVPDQAGVRATRALLNRVSDLEPDDLVVALISGGGSALLCAPVDGVTLAEKQALNDQLLASGAPISDMNVIRKQLSKVKGGRLAAACHPAQLVSLLISDVPGDDPQLIASGPTVGNDSTPQQALNLLDKWGIDLAPHVRAAIGKQTGAVTPDDPRLASAITKIIAAPSKSLAVAAKEANAQGVEARILGDALEGEARDLGAQHARLALKLQAELGDGDPPILLLSGGECTVTRTGNGIGGPNAEYTLAAAIALEGKAGIHVLACDTDGVDGAAEVAGAYAGPDVIERAAKAGVSAQKALTNNDAHSFFAAADSQIITGPTLTNVNDFRAIFIVADSGENSA
jgi:glycerate 2-kinase